MRFARGDLGPYRFTQKRPRTSVSLLQSFAAVGTPKSDLRAVRSALDPQRTSASLTIQRHFCRQRGLSVSSRPRALAYSISVCRAASQRSALVNSCVDITAPLTAPSQLMTIRTWVIISSSPSCWRCALRLRQTVSCFAWRGLDVLRQAVSSGRSRSARPRR